MVAPVAALFSLGLNPIVKAVARGTEAPIFTARMADRKLRWEFLKQQRPFPFAILDKAGQKRFAQAHGADVAETLATLEREDVAADPAALRRCLDGLAASSYVLKPACGYQNRNTFVVRDGQELLRDRSFDPDAAAAAIAADGAFSTYLIEEVLADEAGAQPLTDYKFWCFGATVAHVTVILGRRRTGEASYAVQVADCDAQYAPAPTWCTPGDPASGAVELVALPPRPRCWEAMVRRARALGAAVGAFARVDFYATPRGPAFGDPAC